MSLLTQTLVRNLHTLPTLGLEIAVLDRGSEQLKRKSLYGEKCYISIM